MNTYYLSALDEQFKYECKVINLSYEYPGYTGKEKWAIITDLTEKELIEKYDEIISSYKPFVQAEQYGDYKYHLASGVYFCSS